MQILLGEVYGLCYVRVGDLMIPSSLNSYDRVSISGLVLVADTQSNDP